MKNKMKGFVGVTDNDWFAFLAQQPDIDEVNFWQPGGTGYSDFILKKGKSFDVLYSKKQIPPRKGTLIDAPFRGGIRTHDLLLSRELLYPLSYAPIRWPDKLVNKDIA